MKKIWKYFLILMFFCQFNPSFGQNMHRIIDWKEDFLVKDDRFIKKIPFFDNCTYNEFGFPIYSEQFFVPNNYNDVKVVLSNLVFEDLSLNEINSYNINFSNLSNEIIPEYRIVHEKKRPVLQFSLIPFRKYGNNVQRLISFSYSYTLLINNEIRSTKTYAANSVLSTGKWHKYKITKSGVYKITYDQLKSLGFNNPENVRVYGNAGYQIPIMNYEPYADDLAENPIWMEKGSDGVFNSGDYILFYGHSTTKWTYSKTDNMYIHKLHDYSDESFYFITESNSQGLRILNENSVNVNPDFIVTSYDNYAFHEKEQFNLIKSGKMWVGENFNILLSYDFPFLLSNIVSTEPVKAKINVLTRSGTPSTYTIKANNQTIGSIQAGTVQFGSNATFAASNTSIFSFNSTSSSININISYNKPESNAEGWLNYIILNSRSNLSFNGSQLNFRDINSVGDNKYSEFRISNSTSNISIWDISDSISPKNIVAEFNNSTNSFIVETSNLRQFIAFNHASAYTPILVKEVANQNLHQLENIDFVIVSPPQFLSYANQLAQIHRDIDNYKVEVVTPELLYNEFSSGTPDVGAIRAFMKMLYNKAGTDQSKMPKYLLLYGDGSYNNKQYFAGNSNLILTYQSENSLTPTASFVTDDYFGMLDYGEGGHVGLLDIGIGRFPVKNETEAATMLRKVRQYLSPTSYGDYKNILTFIADDEDGNMHMAQSDVIANRIDTTYNIYNIEKIYLDAYKQVLTPHGHRYPDVNIAINNRINKGSFIVNYVGHGNEINLAHEHVVGMADINSWTNFTKLPLFMTATCEFSRFDDYNRTTAGESILLSPQGGSIAMFTTTRLVYSQSNYSLSQKFYSFIFEQDSLGNIYSLGDLMRLSKNNTGGVADINKRNFSLLGNPALKLTYPKLQILTDSINKIHIDSYTDTINSLSRITISGHISNNGILADWFNGVIYPTVFDKKSNLTTLANDGGAPFIFKAQNNIIYKGAATVENGKFTFSFIVPRDISYTIGQGKISYYADNGANHDASGYTYVNIGGAGNANICDDEGPEIKLFLNDESFVYGSITNESPILIAILKDSLGINTIGTGIGHDITAVINNNTGKTIVLNDFYKSDLDSYQSGRVEYPLQKLETGLHKIKVKCWDVCNNSSEAYIEFIVAKSSELTVENILNYPNPFTTSTNFYFNHNQPNVPLDVIIQIFTVTGKIVKTLESTVISSNFLSTPIFWDGKDDYGDLIGKGIYVYRIKIRTPDGNNYEKFEKLVILK